MSYLVSDVVSLPGIAVGDGVVGLAPREPRRGAGRDGEDGGCCGDAERRTDASKKFFLWDNRCLGSEARAAHSAKSSVPCLDYERTCCFCCRIDAYRTQNAPGDCCYPVGI